MAKSALAQLLNEDTGLARRAYARAWERHEQIGQILAASSPEARKLLEELAAVKSRAEPLKLRDRFTRYDPAFEHQLQVMDLTAGHDLTIRVPPYDVRWWDFQPSDAWGTAAHGPSVDLGGAMYLDLVETYVDRPVAYGGWMTNGAGLAVWFKPRAPSTYIRFAPLLQYDFSWRDESNLQVAHNRGGVATLIQRWLGPGRFETVLDDRKQLWADGTGWYEVHEGEDGGFYNDSHYFFGSSSDWYLVWVWCNSGIDFATKTTFGSSKAYNIFGSKLRFLVFEQWG